MAIELGSSKFSYQKLTKAKEESDEEDYRVEVVRARSVPTNWWKLRRLSGRRRSKVRIAGLRRFLRRRGRVISSVRVSWIKVWKRLKEGRAHFADLFAGNYMFMQVSPTPLGCEKAYTMAQNAYALQYKYSLPTFS